MHWYDQWPGLPHSEQRSSVSEWEAMPSGTWIAFMKGWSEFGVEIPGTGEVSSGMPVPCRSGTEIEFTGTGGVSEMGDEVGGAGMCPLGCSKVMVGTSSASMRMEADWQCVKFLMRTAWRAARLGSWEAMARCGQGGV